MNEKDMKRQQPLLARYLEGRTTQAEEASLRQWFANTPRTEIPTEWRAFAALFAFVDEESATAPPHPHTAMAGLSHRHGWRAALTRVASLAASVVLAWSVWLSVSGANRRNYLMVDGRLILDQRQMEVEMEEALTLVATEEDDPFGALRDME